MLRLSTLNSKPDPPPSEPVECTVENQSQFPSAHHSQASINEHNSQPQYTGTQQHYTQSYPSTQENRQSYSFAHEHNKLPRLNLSTKDSDIFEWNSFWNSYEYESAAYEHPSLSNVQYFNYLKSPLRGEALKTVTGFSLTNANYENAIFFLLKERYRKQQQKKDKDTCKPSMKNTLNGLCQYCESIIVHSVTILWLFHWVPNKEETSHSFV